jgi:hypothetical protein
VSVPGVPRWPAYALAIWELRDYRHRPGTALGRARQDSAGRTLIQARLREVTAEQAGPAHVPAVPGDWEEP